MSSVSFPEVDKAAELVFGARLPLVERFVDLLTEHGVRRGLIGPREVDRLWDRHVLNSAVIAWTTSNSSKALLPYPWERLRCEDVMRSFQALSSADSE